MKQRILLMGVVVTMLLCAIGGCRAQGSENSNEPVVTSGETLTVLNYGKYIEEEVVKRFEAETGITIKYEEYESPEEMYTKYKAGAIDFDVICTSEYIIQKLINEGEVISVDYASELSNYSNIDPALLEMVKSYDPELTYTVPYFYGTVGLMYNTKYVTEEDVSTWNCLWDEKFANEIIMMNSIRDTFIPALTLNGTSLNETDRDKLYDALALLKEQYPIVFAYYVDEIGDEMIAENAQIALVYSGEAAYAMDFNEDLAFSVPDEGTNLWIDSWFIPKTCKNQDAAMKFLDFICEEEMATLNFEYVYYASPIMAVMENQDEEVRANEAINPSAETISRCEIFTALDDDTTAYYSELWEILKTPQITIEKDN